MVGATNSECLPLAMLRHPRFWTAVGEGVEDLDEGSLVLGITLFGGYTSHLVLPRDLVFRLPERLPVKVVGVVGSAHKVPTVEALGADSVIDKSSSDLSEPRL